MRKYELHYRRLRFAEFLRIAHPFRFTAALVWLPLKLGLTSWRPQIIPRPSTLRDFCVLPDDLPEPARSHLTEAFSSVAAHGYVEPFYQLQYSTGTNGERIAGAAMFTRHNSGSHMLQSLMSFAETGDSVSQDQLISLLSDQTTIGTSNGRARFDLMPSASASYHPQMPLNELIPIHLQKLMKLTIDPVSIDSNDDLIREVDVQSDRYFEHMIERGVYTEIGSI